MDQSLFFFHYLFTTSLLMAGLGLPTACHFAYPLEDLTALNTLEINEITDPKSGFGFIKTPAIDEAEQSDNLAASSLLSTQEHLRNHSPPLFVENMQKGTCGVT